MKYIKTFEGLPYRANREKDMDKKKGFLKEKIENHIKSFEDIEIEHIGNDLLLKKDSEPIMEIMFRDTYIGLREEGEKFVDKLGFEELGKIRSKITSVIQKY